MKEEIKNFYDLTAWQASHNLTLAIYQTTMNLPREEQFGITSQIRRAASSVGANIAEGFERYHFNDKIRFYYQARGSVGEVQNFLRLSKDLGFLTSAKCTTLEEQANKVRQLINGLIRSIEKQQCVNDE